MKGRKKLFTIPLAIRAEKALKEAVAEAIADHKRTGDPIVISGKMGRLFGFRRIRLWSGSRGLSIQHQKQRLNNPPVRREEMLSNIITIRGAELKQLKGL